MYMLNEVQIAYVMNRQDLMLEDRIEYLKQNTAPLSSDHDTTGEHKETSDIIQHLADHADPTPTKVHTQYAVGLYRKKVMKQEDAGRLKSALTSFDKYKGKLKPEEKQLTVKNYPTIASIEDKIQPHLGTMTSKKEAEKTLDQPGHKRVYDDDHISVFHLTGEEASKNIYGGGHQRGKTGTSWCTSARSGDCMFKKYAEQGNIHVIHRKSDGAVFQMHPESNSFMDAKDEKISHDDFKSIAPHLHKAWAKAPSILN